MLYIPLEITGDELADRLHSLQLCLENEKSFDDIYITMVNKFMPLNRGIILTMPRKDNLS